MMIPHFPAHVLQENFRNFQKDVMLNKPMLFT